MRSARHLAKCRGDTCARQLLSQDVCTGQLVFLFRAEAAADFEKQLTQVICFGSTEAFA
jgi:hypothetical protein